MGSSIYDVSSMYDQYASSVKRSQSASLENTLSGVNETTSDEELLESCKEFEAYFIEKVISQAKKSILSQEDEEGEYVKMFSDTFNQSLADSVVESGGVGLAQELYESMKKNMSL